MGNNQSFKPTSKNINQNLVHYTNVHDRNLGHIQIFTCKSVPMTFIMQLKRNNRSTDIYHYYKSIQNKESNAIISLYGFRIERSTQCDQCVGEDKVIQYWQYYNYYLTQLLSDRSKRGHRFQEQQLWHLIQICCESVKIFEQYGIIFEIGPDWIVVTPEGKLKVCWAHLESKNNHLKYHQYFNQYQQQSSNQAFCPTTISHFFPSQSNQLNFYLSPEELYLMRQCERSSKVNFSHCNSFKLGMLLFYCITLYNPQQLYSHFHHIDFKRLLTILKKYESRYSFKMYNLVLKCLEPQNRIDINQIYNHCFQQFSEEYEIIISENVIRKEQLQQINIEAKRKHESKKQTRRGDLLQIQSKNSFYYQSIPNLDSKWTKFNSAGQESNSVDTVRKY